ncbi:MAG: tetratricopeptide repeat protein [Blastocatellia bacterium]|nr:tetratricopeptide repeat protein [Blastocatellia bacterium]
MMPRHSDELKKVESLLQNGEINQGIEELRRMVAENPSDVVLMERLGDVYVSIGRFDRGIQYFVHIGDQYLQQGYVLKAIAIYKKAQKLLPQSTALMLKLADAYARQGFTGEAVKYYREVADSFEKQDFQTDAYKILKRVTDLEPENLELRLELAEKYRQRKMPTEAHDFYLAAGKLLEKNGRYAECLQAYMKALALNLRSKPALKSLAGLFVDRKEPDKVVAMFSRILQNNPGDTELLRFTAQTYLEIGLVDKAEELLLSLYEVGEECTPELMEVAEKRAASGETDRVVMLVNFCLESLFKNQQTQQAVFLLETVLQHQPGHLGSLICLRSIFQRTGNNHRLTAILNELVAAGLKMEDREIAINALEQLRKLEPENQAHTNRLTEFGVQVAPLPVAPVNEGFYFGEPSDAPPQPAPAPGEASTLETPVLPAIDLDDLMKQADGLLRQGQFQQAVKVLEIAVSTVPDSDVPRLKLVGLYLSFGQNDKAADQCLALSSIYEKKGDSDNAKKMLSEAYGILGEEEPALGEAKSTGSFRFVSNTYEMMSVPTLHEMNQPAFAGQVLEPAPVQSVGGAEPVPLQIEPKPITISIPVPPGFTVQPSVQLPYAPATLELVQNLMPDPSSSDDEAEEVDEEAGPAELYPDGHIVRMEETNDDIQEVLAQLKKVKPSALPTDYETHFNLGLAFKDMELFDLAIQEFQFTLSCIEYNFEDPRFLLICDMMGLCQMGKQDFKTAAAWYRKALSGTNLREPERTALRYDLACALEAQGKLSAALEIFEEIYAADIHYREAEGRIKQIQERRKLGRRTGAVETTPGTFR